MCRVTQHVISSRVDPRLNVYAIEVLVKQGLLQGPSYDAHLASIVDRYEGGNSSSIDFVLFSVNSKNELTRTKCSPFMYLLKRGFDRT